MKKTIRINLSGLVFNIDEDAYLSLKEYLNALNFRFAKTQEGNEIIADIEARIAEIFQQRVNENKEVINSDDVQHVIEIMGHPEDFDDDEPQEESSSEPHTEKQEKRASRRMYRDPDNRIFGGVCSGISQYFGFDPVILRVLFLLATLLYGSAILVYILLWIVLPQAKTTAQKLEMAGEPVTISNIERSIKNEFQNVKESFSNFGKSNTMTKTRAAGSRAASRTAEALSAVAKIIIIIAGIVLIAGGMISLIALLGSMFFSETFVTLASEGENTFNLSSMLHALASTPQITFGYIGLLLLTVIPVLFVIYIGLKMLFDFKSNARVVFLSAAGAWLLGLIITLFAGFSVGKNFVAEQKNEKHYKIDLPEKTTLYLKTYNNQLFDFHETPVDLDEVVINRRNRKERIYIKPELVIKKSDSGKAELVVLRRSRGRNKKIAGRNISKISYNWQQRDSTLLFEPYFALPHQARWREQEITIVLKLPVGQAVYLHPSLRQILDYSETADDVWYAEMPGKKWLMTYRGLGDFQTYYKALYEEQEKTPADSTQQNQNKERELENQLDQLENQ